MPNIPLIKRLDIKYNGEFTLNDVFNDQLIQENIEKFYVPQVKVMGSTFIKKDEDIISVEDGAKRIRFIYMNQRGLNITNPDSSYIQIAQNGTGFLAKLSLSRSNYTPANLRLEYFVDISKITYRVDSVLMANKSNQVIYEDLLHFENIVPSDYTNIQLDVSLLEFEKHRDELFEKYF